MADTPATTVDTAPAVGETRFHAMGGDARIVLVDGEPQLLDDARAHIELLEARWGRFRASSELGRLNAHPGVPVVVSRDTFAVIARAVDAWRRTRGWFDPTVLPALRAVGDPMPSPGCAGVVLDRAVPAVTLPAGVVLDLGGIAKGSAADLVATALVAAGARGACVDLGGNLRVVGSPATGAAWTVTVEHAGELRIAEGAVATSTGAHAGLASVTVVAAEAWWAAALAKAALVAGIDAGAELVCDSGAAGLFLRDDGRVEELPGLHSFRPFRAHE